MCLLRQSNVQSQWKHLADVELQDVDRAEIKVILGSDVTEIIIPREVREGPKGSLFGIKTKLGWTVTGTPKIFSQFRIRMFHSRGFT